MKIHMKMYSKVKFNQYRSRSQCLWMGFAHLKDALIGIFSFGSYEGFYSSDASSQILMKAMKIRKAERSVGKAVEIETEENDVGC